MTLRKLIGVTRHWVRAYGRSRVAIGLAALYVVWSVAYVMSFPAEDPPNLCFGQVKEGEFCVVIPHSFYLAGRNVDTSPVAGTLFALQLMPAVLILRLPSLAFPRPATPPAEVVESYVIFIALLIVSTLQWWLIGVGLKAGRVFERASTSIRGFGRSRLAVIIGSGHLAAGGLLLASHGEDVGAWPLLDLPAFVLTALILAPVQNAFLAHEGGDWPWTVLLLVLGTFQWWLVGVAWAASHRAPHKTAGAETAA